MPAGSVDGIGALLPRGHRDAGCLRRGRGVAAGTVSVGAGQELRFRETDLPLPPYDGHHIQVYAG